VKLASIGLVADSFVRLGGAAIAANPEFSGPRRRTTFNRGAAIANFDGAMTGFDRRTGSAASRRESAHGSRQNQRSSTTTVSPGFIWVMTGTTWRATTPSTGRLSTMVGRKARGVNPPAMATAVSAVMFGT
jgi:hypothetical protein